MLVENNITAGEYFQRMRKLSQAPTHTIWFENADKPYNEEDFLRLTSAAVFQKTDFKSEDAKNPKPGTYADMLINQL